MSKHDERLEIDDVPAQEGVSEAEAAEDLAASPEEKRNFTETHPEFAKEQRARNGDDALDV
jgi:hypothetical protein